LNKSPGLPRGYQLDVSNVDGEDDTENATMDENPINQTAFSRFSGFEQKVDYGYPGGKDIIEKWDEENDDQEIYDMMNKAKGRRLVPNATSSNNLLNLNFNNYDGTQTRAKSRQKQIPVEEKYDNLQSQQTQDLELYVDKLNI
jgi:hypothetical protein